MKRLVLWLACCGLALGTATPAAAEWENNNTDFLEMVGDARPFSIFDGSMFDRRPYAPQGFGVRWSRFNYVIDDPPAATIGNPNVAPRFVFDGIFPTLEYNNATTAEAEAKWHNGDILEVVYMEENIGWSVRSFKAHGHNQEYTSSDVHMMWGDPLGLLPFRFLDLDNDGIDDDLNNNGIYGRDGIDDDSPADGLPDVPPDGDPSRGFPTDFGDSIALPIVFDWVTTKYRTKLWGLDANRVYRFSRLHYGGWLEGMVGVRYFKFDDDFLIDGRLDDTETRILVIAARAALANIHILTKADNNMLAPQIGFRWFRTDRRFTTEIDCRAGVGFNWQSVTQSYNVASEAIGRGTGLVDQFTGAGGDNVFHDTELFGFVEGNYTLTYKLTSQFSVHAGYNLLCMNGLARPSNMVNYTLPNVGILGGNNREHLIAHGWQLGFDYNR